MSEPVGTETVALLADLGYELTDTEAALVVKSIELECTRAELREAKRLRAMLPVQGGGE